MNKIDLWHFCDELSVVEAVLLILGLDPADQGQSPEYSAHPPTGYEAVSTAIKNNILSKKLSATLSYDLDFHGQTKNENWNNTRIHVEDLKKWLSEKNFTNNFFFQENNNSKADYLDPQNEFYAPKLSAAVNAWLEVTSDPELFKGKTPKQAIEKWLRQNANDYGLTKEDGNPNESAIAEICKITNWKPEGGVAKTTPQIQTKRTKSSAEPEPEIPF